MQEDFLAEVKESGIVGTYYGKTLFELLANIFSSL